MKNREGGMLMVADGESFLMGYASDEIGDSLGKRWVWVNDYPKEMLYM
jgi:hypothetical protein